eukprot:233115-Chlamydomonas_euryale.AAC.3
MPDVVLILRASATAVAILIISAAAAAGPAIAAGPCGVGASTGEQCDAVAGVAPRAGSHAVRARRCRSPRSCGGSAVFVARGRVAGGGAAGGDAAAVASARWRAWRAWRAGRKSADGGPPCAAAPRPQRSPLRELP